MPPQLQVTMFLTIVEKQIVSIEEENGGGTESCFLLSSFMVPLVPTVGLILLKGDLPMSLKVVMWHLDGGFFSAAVATETVQGVVEEVAKKEVDDGRWQIACTVATLAEARQGLVEQVKNQAKSRIMVPGR